MRNGIVMYKGSVFEPGLGHSSWLTHLEEQGEATQPIDFAICRFWPKRNVV